MRKLFVEEYGKKFQGSSILIAVKYQLLFKNLKNILDDIKFISRFNIHVILVVYLKGQEQTKKITNSLPKNCDIKFIKETSNNFGNDIYLDTILLSNKHTVSKIIFLENEKIRDNNNRIIEIISEKNKNQILENCNQKTKNYILKQFEILGASNSNLKRMHIISGLEKNGIKQEVFSLEGVGTMIIKIENEFKNNFSNCKIGDTSTIYQTIKPYVKEGSIRYRSYEYIEDNINNFFKLEIDGIISGFLEKIELNHNIIEMGSVVVNNRFQNNKIGILLIENFLNRVKKEGYNQILVITGNEKLIKILVEKFGFYEVSLKNKNLELIVKRRIKLSPSKRYLIN